MKRFFKICTALTIIFGILGAGLLIAAFGTGAKIPAVINNVTKEIGIGKGGAYYSFGKEGIRDIEIDIGGNDLTIVQGSGDQVSLDNDGDARIQAKIEDHGRKLKIKQRFNFFHFWNTRGTAVLTLPKDMSLDELELDCGSGEVKANTDLTANEVSVDCGSGDIEIRSLDAVKTDIDSGSGDVTISMKGTEEEYSYEVDSGSGDVYIGSRNYSGSDTSYGNENGSREIEIDSGSGDIRIKFLGAD